MTHRYVFDYIQNHWAWTCVDNKKTVVKRSKETFSYYLECLEHAKLDGLVGEPLFETQTGDLEAAPRYTAPFTQESAR